ncbi:TOBE domain-containing protein [Cardiobacteriaceae bacterium TAE3-ERU3]|nr:TOBE domain-containing protein [Cardiobacteriaceae bacterium TAE3-ERU3]
MWRVTVKKTLGGFTLDASLQSDAERCVIIGQSGTGKSLLLKAIAGMMTPDAGHIQVNGRVLDGLDMAQRRVAYLFQDYALFPHLTVAQQVAFATKKGWLNPRQRIEDKRVRYWLEALEIEHLAGQYPAQLSGGQQQRTALARALVSEPEVLLLDEPFAALDTTLRDQMRRLLAEWQARLNLPLLMITHDPDDAQIFGDDVWQMVREDGRGSLQRLAQDNDDGADIRLRLLAAVEEYGDLMQAADKLGMTLSTARQCIDALNNFAGTALVQRDSDDGDYNYRVSAAGQEWLENYQQATGRQQRFIAHLSSQQREVLMNSYWQTSAHNQLRGKIVTVLDGAVNCEVQLAVGKGQILTAMISKGSAERLVLSEGMDVVALINAADVMLATESLAGVLSARNQLSGTVQRIEKGAVNDEVIVDIGHGVTLAATITHGSAENLAIAEGQTVYAVIKAPNVMLAVAR